MTVTTTAATTAARTIATTMPIIVELLPVDESAAANYTCLNLNCLIVKKRR